MNFLFQKLDINLQNILGNLNQDVRTLELPHFEEYFADVNIKTINNLLYKKYKIDYFPNNVNLTKISPPGVGVHTDAFNVTINVYLNARNSVTTFYRELSEDSSTIITKKNTKGEFQIKVYDEEKLEVISRIKTKPGEILLFNSSVPHSVAIPPSEPDRLIFRITWDSKYSYQDIYNNFNKISS